jgi:hypothetical protein
MNKIEIYDKLYVGLYQDINRSNYYCSIMSEKPSWVTADTYKEWIHDVVEGAIEEFEYPESLSEFYEGTEYEDGFIDVYDPNKLYANPYDNSWHFPEEDGIPDDMGRLLREYDSIYSAVAQAAGLSIERVVKMPNISVEPDEMTEFVIGIMENIASRLQVRQVSGQSAYVVFNKPIDAAEIHF